MKNYLLIYDWTNGVVMIGIIVLVCLILIGVLLSFMTGKKGKSYTPDN